MACFFIDGYNRRIQVYFLGSKYEFFGYFKEFKALVENQTSKNINILTNNDGEFYLIFLIDSIRTIEYKDILIDSIRTIEQKDIILICTPINRSCGTNENDVDGEGQEYAKGS